MTPLTPRRLAVRRAFTLVEMLVVIAIIAILAGLITGAAVMARLAAKRAVVKMEISQLAMALEHYKTEVGEYPPDFVFIDRTDGIGDKARNDVVRHIRKRFPRYQVADWPQLRSDILANYPTLDINTFNPAVAVLFFLGGLPEQNSGQWIPAGFHSDPTSPFRTGGPRSKPFYDFTLDRIKVQNSGMHPNIPYYAPSYIDAPFVYFKARSNEYGATTDDLKTVIPSSDTFETGNDCLPYLDEDKTTAPADRKPNLPASKRMWRERSKFQIITAGLDGKFGEGVAFRYSKEGIQINLDGTVPDPSNLQADNLDNLTSFAESTLEDEMQ